MLIGTIGSLYLNARLMKILKARDLQISILEAEIIKLRQTSDGNKPQIKKRYYGKKQKNDQPSN